ncbi:MAG TPA: RNase adapter RapZ [Gammaproteobacteria bacterium]|nr:RNase adapter RapZ [Gammaproteobacteria bacterium]
MNIEIISGLSGSGKSLALQALEDIGYYCVDNLPAVLLTDFAKILHDAPSLHSLHQGAAVSIDSRNKQFLKQLPTALDRLLNSGIDCRILFLHASEEVLIKRFSETRRKHPLTDAHTSLLEGIRQEKTLLAEVADKASLHFDTSLTTPHELRRLIKDAAGGHESATPVVLVESFGFKYGPPIDADYLFDVRCLPNPYWHEELRDLTGQDTAVKDYLSAQPEVLEMFEDISKFFARWLPAFTQEGRSYVTVAIGCTGGKHRSVYLAQKLANYFTTHGHNVQLRHRELNNQIVVP